MSKHNIKPEYITKRQILDYTKYGPIMKNPSDSWEEACYDFMLQSDIVKVKHDMKRYDVLTDKEKEAVLITYNWLLT